MGACLGPLAECLPLVWGSYGSNSAQWVDVRDLARAHVLALTVPEAGGERLIIRGGSYVWQQFGEYSFGDMCERLYLNTEIS